MNKTKVPVLYTFLFLSQYKIFHTRGKYEGTYFALMGTNSHHMPFKYKTEVLKINLIFFSDPQINVFC